MYRSLADTPRVFADIRRPDRSTLVLNPGESAEVLAEDRPKADAHPLLEPVKPSKTTKE